LISKENLGLERLLILFKAQYNNPGNPLVLYVVAGRGIKQVNNGFLNFKDICGRASSLYMMFVFRVLDICTRGCTIHVLIVFWPVEWVFKAVDGIVGRENT